MTKAERTLIILKPDSVQRRFVGDILGRFERKGFRVVGLKMARLDRGILRSTTPSTGRSLFIHRSLSS